jgi:hypothetical protein
MYPFVLEDNLLRERSHFDLEGLVRAFQDDKRDKFEYILDADTGRVHFVPIKLLQQAEKGVLRPDAEKAQDRERAHVALQYVDDLSGRFELVPFLEPALMDEWRKEFQEQAGVLGEVAPEHRLDWETYRLERIYEEIDLWLDETGILDEDWDEEE